MSEQLISQSEATIQYSTFQVGELLFGIDVMQVQEVLRYQEMTRVPLAPDLIRGLINLRGQIVTAVDLRSRMGLTSENHDRRPMNIVVRSAEGVVSLLVDQIGDVLQVDKSAYEKPPLMLPPDQRNLIEGVYKLDNRLLLILDIERALQEAIPA